MADKDILELIARQIDDSYTWCNFSKVSKTTNAICKRLIREIKLYFDLDGQISNQTDAIYGETGSEINTSILPSGIKHGYFEDWSLYVRATHQSVDGYYINNIPLVKNNYVYNPQRKLYETIIVL